ncbi:MAG: glutamyl-tRNA synthetase, glutamyl-tRNA synthetase [Candidatus Adlerbacteria bacterium]|nr:glutamyl-tRNA synthetase, glutamyl-tRNA synthetase [Candidatus Adlerbacteria bacterium]
MNSTHDTIVTRFPPSPTGLLQAGNVRTAVFNYLFAKKHGGKFVLRIEDTDRERSKSEYEQNIIDTMKWLGFEYDEFYRQSEHAPRHSEVLSKLIEQGDAYVSQETPKEAGQRAEVIRFKNPNTAVTFTDVIRGDITIDTTDLGDFVIGRSLTEPLYHLGVTVDDFDEGITHVIRGEDHISNTPRQILILRALGAPIPTYAHLPLVFGTDKQKLSKRRGAKAITEYRDEGYLPEAMINYLALLGWHPEGKDEGEQEVFTVPELLEQFTLERIQKSSGVFDEAKLKWFNYEHLKRLSDEEFTDRITTFMAAHGQEVPEYMPQILTLLRERSQTLGEARDALIMGEFAFMVVTPNPGPDLLIQGAKADAATVKRHLEHIHRLLESVGPEFTDATVKAAIFDYATEVGRASVLWPLRVALSGREKSPDPFTLAGLIGKEHTLSRIVAAAELL